MHVQYSFVNDGDFNLKILFVFERCSRDVCVFRQVVIPPICSPSVSVMERTTGAR